MVRGFDQPQEALEAAREAEEDQQHACERGEHKWNNVTDWEGDPGVMNGTRTFYYKECRYCGETSSWDGRPDEEDPDDARDRERDDAPHWAQYRDHADDSF